MAPPTKQQGTRRNIHRSPVKASPISAFGWNTGNAEMRGWGFVRGSCVEITEEDSFRIAPEMLQGTVENNSSGLRWFTSGPPTHVHLQPQLQDSRQIWWQSAVPSGTTGTDQTGHREGPMASVGEFLLAVQDDSIERRVSGMVQLWERAP
ncbi:predicted protein [Histoplasma capsulatum G186AR]|uniref:Uncharacterized protein n=1 Tax=Ajellomyces capsulatus (strain G186AR / H82 / ATCC MYA-2454 / RMSCC 2432) TaxID=447093 RepID=C0NYQ9_AJECG|nr:uncharacterized protein HCBG_08289 [Histoplasma capsulatum G186AR]EEH03349.1 predicted protein [Histoplasma capsulatum G186AR]